MQDLSDTHPSPLQCARNNLGGTLLQRAIDFGFDIEETSEGGWTAMHWAASDGNQEIIEILLENGALINSEDTEGNTPLTIALMCRRIEVARTLIEHGADIGKIKSNLVEKNPEIACLYESVKIKNGLKSHHDTTEALGI